MKFTTKFNIKKSEKQASIKPGKGSKSLVCLCILAGIILVAAAVGGFLFYNHSKKEKSKQNSEVLKEICLDTGKKVLYQDAFSKLDIADNYNEISKKQNTAKLVCEIEEYPQFSGLEDATAEFILDRNNREEAALLRMQISHKGIPVLSGRATLKGHEFRLFIPSLYSDILKVDTTDASSQLENSLIGTLLKGYMDLSVIDQLDYATLFKGEGISSDKNLMGDKYQEFSETYKEDLAEINEQMYCEKTKDGYDITLKKKAILLLLKDLKDFAMRDGDLSQIYVKYEDGINDTLEHLETVLTFDLIIHFQVSDKNELQRISILEEETKQVISADLLFTHNQDTCDVQGDFTLNLPEDTYTGEILVKHNADENTAGTELSMHVNSSESSIFTLDSNINYLMEEARFQMDVKCTMLEELYGIEGTLFFKENTKKRLDYRLEKLHITQENKTILDLTADFTLEEGHGQIPDLKGNECDVLHLTFKDITKLSEELTTNISKLQELLR